MLLIGSSVYDERLIQLGGIKKMGKFHNTTRWRKLRKRKLAKAPLCELCLMVGRVMAASEVHHLLKVDDFPDEVMNIFYLQSLCSTCHDEIVGPAYKKWTAGGL